MIVMKSQKGISISAIPTIRNGVQIAIFPMLRKLKSIRSYSSPLFSPMPPDGKRAFTMHAMWLGMNHVSISGMMLTIHAMANDTILPDAFEDMYKVRQMLESNMIRLQAAIRKIRCMALPSVSPITVKRTCTEVCIPLMPQKVRTSPNQIDKQIRKTEELMIIADKIFVRASCLRPYLVQRIMLSEPV